MWKYRSCNVATSWLGRLKANVTNVDVPRSNPDIWYKYFSFDFIVILCEEIEIERI